MTVQPMFRRRAIAGLTLLLTLTGAAAAHDLVPGAPQDRPVLLRGGDLYTVSDGVLPATDLLFEGGLITAIGQDLPAPPGAEVVDVGGQRIYPGLIALSTTAGLSGVDAVRATRDLDEVGDLNPEASAWQAYEPDSEILPTLRHEGITTIQVTPQGRLLRGRSAVLQLDGWNREDAGLREVDGIHLAWPPVAVRRSPWIRESEDEQRKSMQEQREALREAFLAARAYAAEREAGTRGLEDLRWEAMRPLWNGALPLYVHADDRRQVIEALQFADEFGLRMVLFGGADAAPLAAVLAERGIPVVVDVTAGLPYRPEEDHDLPGRLPEILRAAGVQVAIAALDAGWPARNLALEGAGRAVAFGLPPAEALRAVTRTPAEILGIADRTGALEVGLDATLVVSRGDLLDTLGHQVSHMWIEGRPVELLDRQRRLEQKYRTRIERFAAASEAPVVEGR